MIEFIVRQKDTYSLNNFELACDEIIIKEKKISALSSGRLQISAEPTTEENYPKVILLVEQFFELESVKIDCSKKLIKDEDTKNVVTAFSDSKTNKFFNLLINAVQRTIDAGKDYKGILLSAIQLLDYNLSPPTVVDFDVANIVDINLGTNMTPELSGGHVWALVVQKETDSSFVIPILKKDPDDISKNDININGECVDISVNKLDEKNTFLSLGYARWISNKRIAKTIGSMDYNYFKEVVAKIPQTFTFEV